MYLLNELLMTLPLVLYVLLRIRKLISRPLYKNLFVVFYLLVIIAFPLSEVLSHRTSAAWTRAFMRIGYYALPFLLYIVLIVILSDLVLGILRLLKVLSRDTVRAPRFRKARLAFYLLAPTAVVAFGIWNFHHIRYHDFSVEIPRRSSDSAQLKIAFASDFHLGEQTEADFMARFVDKVNALKPDIVLIGGDVLEGDRRDYVLAQFEAEFRRIEAKYGVYGVLGNHDRFAGSRADFFDKAGIRILRDEIVKIDNAFYLAGRLSGRAAGRKSAADLFRNTPEDLPLVLLDHRPADIDAVSRTRADIQLSGHTHHGQLFPINFITDGPYELGWGHLLKGRTHFYVTSGIQLWGPRVRTIGYSEILVLNVALRDAGSR
jgi:predicted MPP superfamily phosphohydrolase